MALFCFPITAVSTSNGDIDMATFVLNEVAIENHTSNRRLPRHHVSLAMVQGSIAGVTGWADWMPGDADIYGDPGHFPQTKSRTRREIEEYRRLKKAGKVDRPAWNTPITT